LKLGIFVSWSGDRSRQLAREFKWWLPRILSSVRPWMSESDIHKGDRWSEQVGRQLRDHRIGIICVTPENMASEWLLFEAGALSKTFGEGRVCPVLLGIQPKELEGPLTQFQATVFDREEMFALAESLNRELGDDRADDPVLRDAFDKFWPELAQRVEKLSRLELSPQSVHAVVRSFAKHGLPEPRIGSSVYFEGGFESHGLYETICSLVTNRFYVFGRKNRKLFDKDHASFFDEIRNRLACGLDFRCLFLDPGAPDHVLLTAHEDSNFKDQLNDAVKQAGRVLRSAGLNPDDHCRTYSFQRTTTSITVDDAVLYTHIRLTPGGVASRLTKCAFSVVNANSPIGQELTSEFLDMWDRGGKLPSIG
jgi:TIR domain